MDYPFLAIFIYFVGVLLAPFSVRASTIVKYVGAGLFLLAVLVVALGGGYRAT